MCYYRCIKTDIYEVVEYKNKKTLYVVGFSCHIHEKDIYDYIQTKRGYLSITVNKVCNHYIYITDGFNVDKKISIKNFIKNIITLL
jgi:hypothetical protein